MENTDWQKAIEFHGHVCPGLAIGFKAVAAAREKMGIIFSSDEEIVCVTENDACGVDAIQVLTGCSIGKGNLIYRGTGKMAFTFFNRKNGDSLRMIVKPFKQEMERDQRKDYILSSDVDEIFDFMKPNFDLPDTARIFESIVCEICKESAPEHKMRLQDKKKVCLDCFNKYERGW